jgi:hypothetical protein
MAVRALRFLAQASSLVPAVDRTFLAVRQGLDARARDALADQEFADGVGAAGAQGQVVLAGAAFVGVAFDAHAHGRIAVQPLGLGRQGRLGVAA